MAATLEPRERGGPIQKYWEEASTISQLDSVKAWLLKNAKKVIINLSIFLVYYLNLTSYLLNYHDRILDI